MGQLIRRMNTQSLSKPPAASVVLRGYQEDAIQSVLSYLKAGQRRLGISLATGSGKTVIFSRLIERIPPRSPDATRTLILAHRQELVESAARHCSQAYPDKTVEIEMANLKASGHADITVASVATLISGDRLQKFRPEKYGLILCDEAHHIVARSYLDVLDHFSLLDKDAVAAGETPALVGVSATFSRADGLGLGKCIDHIVYHKDYVDMIKDEWLAGVVFTTVDYKVDLSKIKLNQSGDFQLPELSKAVNTQQSIEVAIRSWMARAADRGSTLVFGVDVAHVVAMTNTFRSFGVDAHLVTGDTPRAQRSALLDAFKNREFPVLLNCGVFTEGTDIPNIDCILLARPTRSRNLLVQMIGRGMRLSPGKKNCHVIDLVASLETGIVTVPTLFGLDPDELLTEVSAQELADRKYESKAKLGLVPLPKSPAIKPAEFGVTVQYTDYDSVFDLMEDTSAERHIRGLSNFAWVSVGESRYILSDRSGSYLTISPSPTPHSPSHASSVPSWRVTITRTLPPPLKSRAPYATPRQLAAVETFTHAVAAADTFAKEHFAYQVIFRNAAWRLAPASESQLKFLNKLRGGGDELLTSEGLQKGRAGDMIAKIKHGARGLFGKVEVRRRREARIRERSETVARREFVKVGPLAE